MNRYDMKSEYNHIACEDQVVPVEDSKGYWVRHEDAAALAAQVEALRNIKRYSMTTEYNKFACEDQVVVSEFDDGDYVKYADIEKHIEKTPQQHLAEIRAQAGRAGFVAGYMLCNDGSPLIKHNYEGFADKYAESIRQGVK